MYPRPYRGGSRGGGRRGQAPPPPSQITLTHARLERALERLAHGWRA